MSEPTAVGMNKEYLEKTLAKTSELKYKFIAANGCTSVYWEGVSDAIRWFLGQTEHILYPEDRIEENL